MWNKKPSEPNGGQQDVRALVLQGFESEIAARVEAMRDALRAEVHEAERQQWQESIKEHRAEAKAETEREWLAKMADIENDIDSRVALATDQARLRMHQQYEQLMDELRGELQNVLRRAEQAETTLKTLIDALLPTPGQSVALGRFVQIRAFPLADVNRILARCAERIEAVPGSTDFPMRISDTQQCAALVRQTAASDAARQAAEDAVWHREQGITYS